MKLPSEDNEIRTNSPTAWLLAARPKTLTGASVPVMIGVALALRTAGVTTAAIIPAILCFLFAFLMQIDSNLINDYFDYRHGNDDRATRLGPKRACAEGWITTRAMLRGIAVVSLAACTTGLPLISYGGWVMVAVGAACVVFAFLYTTWFSYRGLGDVLVIVFFGIVPVYFTWYTCVPPELQGFRPGILAIGVACGLVIDTLLMVNNYRDRDNDRRDGKRTLVVRLGTKWAERLYADLPLLAEIIIYTVIVGNALPWWKLLLFVALMVAYFRPHYRTAAKLVKIGKGKALNMVLGLTARDIFIFGLVTATQILIA